MAEVGGAVLGYAVTKLLDEVLTALGHLKNRSTNLLQLQNLLERLQPAVKEFSFVQDEKHPAGKWVIKLHEQLAKSRDLVNASTNVNRNIFRLYRTSKGSLEVYASIQALLLEAAALQWASGMSIQRISTGNDVTILAELREAKERDEQLFRRIAALSSKGDIVNTISKLQQVPNSESLDGSSSSTVPSGTLHPDSTVPRPKVTFGGEAVANELISYLLHGDCKKWVGLWGMGGIGKSFIASKVYHDSSIKQHFSGGIFWLTVSKDQAGPKHLFKQLLEKIEGPKSIPQFPDNLEMAKSYLKSMLERDRVLLVLDDVWQKDVLKSLDVISESKKGVILVTTRDQEILSGIIDVVKIFEIPRLSREDSWQLFNYHAFGAREKVVPSELEAVAKNVAEECQRLPLALEVIGSTMADKELVPAQKAVGQTTLRVWEIALERLKSATYGNSEYEALYLRLQLSVDSLLEQDSRLQDCFFYFAAFPEDEEVSVRDLVRMWIAEGLVQDDVNSSFSGEEEGKVLLGFLVAKSMIEVVAKGRHCKVHDVMRDLAQRNLKRNFATGEEIQASARNCLYAPGLKESKLPSEWTLSSTPSSARRLSLRGNDLRQFPEPKQFEGPHLQVLILSKNKNLQSLSTTFFQNLANLKVLDLRNTAIKSIPGALLQRLRSLVVLDLSNCDELQEVSDEIDSLHKLEFLSLGGANSLQKLPRVKNLTKLKWFSSWCPPVKNMNTHNGRGCWQGWLSRRTRYGWSRRGIPYVLPASLTGLSLRAFLPLGGKYSFDLSSLCALEKLELGCMSCPAGMGELHHLKTLEIIECSETPILALGELPMLEDLSISSPCESPLGTESYVRKGAFACLKRLNLFFLDTEESLFFLDTEEMFVFRPGAMPKLERLFIDIRRRVRFPTSMTELHSLKYISIEVGSEYGTSDENLKDIEEVFREPDSFPHLELLSIDLHLGDQVSIVLPEYMEERAKQGKLSIDIKCW